MPVAQLDRALDSDGERKNCKILIYHNTFRHFRNQIVSERKRFDSETPFFTPTNHFCTFSRINQILFLYAPVAQMDRVCDSDSAKPLVRVQSGVPKAYRFC